MKTPLIVNELYAANDGTAAATIDQAYHLKRGAIAFFEEDGTLIPDTVSGPDQIDGSVVNAVVGLGDGKLININDITRDTFRYNYKVYTPSALKRMTIGGDGTNYSLNLPSVIPAGAVSIIHVYDTTQLNDTNPYREYIIPVAPTASAQDIIDAQIAAINNDERSIVVATASATDKGIVFTSKALDFMVTAGGVLANADVLEYNKVNHKHASYTVAANVSAYNVGSGTPSQLKTAESYFFATRGDGNYQNDAESELYTEDRLANPAINYDQYNCTYYLDSYPLKKSDDYVNELTIYFDNSVSAIKIALDAILGAL
jgi:hypothetical protein